nr:uncharacterized protein LOC109148758 [Ipomoea batatas]
MKINQREKERAKLLYLEKFLAIAKKGGMNTMTEKLEAYTHGTLRCVRKSIDEGSSLKAVASAYTSNKQAICPAISGKVWSFKQPDRISILSFSK